MRCPRCGHVESKVIDSRTLRDGEAIRRRRECEDCSLRFTTYERVEESLTVIKKGTQREPFDRAKVRTGIVLACKKREVTAEVIDGLVEDVIQQVYSLGEREIDSRQIGGFVTEGLKAIDDVAYLRFKSVYERFEDTGEFRRALDQLTDDKGDGDG